jgi:hypothetical protein
MTKNAVRFVLAAAALVALAPQAQAGKALDHQVSISTYDHSASGAFYAVRHSPDSTQWISCTVKVHPPSAAPELHCKAVDKFEKELFCSTFDPALVQVALGISDYSWILFKCDDKDLVGLTVSKSSYSQP